MDIDALQENSNFIMGILVLKCGSFLEFVSVFLSWFINDVDVMLR